MEVLDLKESENLFMSLAFNEASKGTGYCSPNPCVGCVVVSKDGIILSTGYHKKYGDAHAEQMALNNKLQYDKIQNKDDFKDATAYVTLEPCSHIGQTESCAELLINRSVGKVVCALRDPDHKVSGSGFDKLEKAGVKVVLAKNWAQKAESFLEKYLYARTNLKSYVTLKWAQTIDGSMSLNGKSKWITNENQRKNARIKRGLHDCVVVGWKTLIEDNPRLDLRDTPFKDKANKVLILDPKGHSLNFEEVRDLNVFKLRDLKLVKIVIPNFKIKQVVERQSEDKFLFLGCDLKDENYFDLNLLRKKTYQDFKCNSIFVEGGAYTLAQFIKQNQYNKVCKYEGLVYAGSRGVGIKNHLVFEEFSKINN